MILEIGQRWPKIHPSVGVFGKHPDQRDFICLGQSGSALHAVDLWMQRGLDLAQRELHQDYLSAYAAKFFHCIVYRPDHGEWTLAGVAGPSADAFGRRFPLLVYEQIPTRFADKHPALLPSLAGTLFVELAEIAYDGSELRSLSAIANRLEQFFCAEQSPAELAAAWHSSEARYRNFLEDTLCSDLGTPDCPGPKLLGDLISVLRGLSADTRSLRVGVEIPLVHSAYARGLEIRFYVELCQRLRDTPLMLSLAWRTGVPTPTISNLMLSFREPEGAFFAALLGAARWAVWRPGAGKPAPLIGSRLTADSTPSEDTTLSELMAELSPKAQPRYK